MLNTLLINARLALLTSGVEDVIKGAQGAKAEGAFTNVNKAIQTTGNGIYAILGTFAVLVFLILGGFAFVKGFVMGTPQERQEFKSGLLFKLLMIIGFFALAGAIVLLSNLGSGLFGATAATP